MADHWRTTRLDADAMSGTANGPTRRAFGWLFSVALTCSTILLVWHFHL
jgi:hypothetical protein